LLRNILLDERGNWKYSRGVRSRGRIGKNIKKTPPRKGRKWKGTRRLSQTRRGIFKPEGKPAWLEAGFHKPIGKTSRLSGKINSGNIKLDQVSRRRTQMRSTKTK